MYKTVAIHARSTFWTHREFNDESVVDSDDLSKEIETKSNELAEQGYELISVTPIISGNIENGSGYYQTESVILTAKKSK